MRRTIVSRAKIVDLCKRAGLSRLMIEEIESGADADRCRQIFKSNLKDCRPSVLVLSDPDAAWDVYHLLYGDITFAE
jgi:hypothetical protein